MKFRIIFCAALTLWLSQPALAEDAEASSDATAALSINAKISRLTLTGTSKLAKAGDAEAQYRLAIMYDAEIGGATARNATCPPLILQEDAGCVALLSFVHPHSLDCFIASLLAMTEQEMPSLRT
ncbi:MAG: hypothetical protein LBB65_05480 [Burkholderiales bacterium]|jgi:hypothetical protein|nr:hypothetical protein [Burkholderiales bacterium]